MARYLYRLRTTVRDDRSVEPTEAVVPLDEVLDEPVVDKPDEPTDDPKPKRARRKAKSDD